MGGKNYDTDVSELGAIFDPYPWEAEMSNIGPTRWPFDWEYASEPGTVWAPREKYEQNWGMYKAAHEVVQARIEKACEVMHDAYERAAVGAGWETNPASRKPWSDVPESNKVTMRAAVRALIKHLEGEN